MATPTLSLAVAVMVRAPEGITCLLKGYVIVRLGGTESPGAGVGVGNTGVFVGPGAGVFVGVRVGVDVGGTGVLVGAPIGVFVGAGTGVFVGVGPGVGSATVTLFSRNV